MGIEILFASNIPMAKSKFDNAVRKTLEACGLTAVSYASAGCPVDTGALRNSITYSVEETTCYVGTNMEYAPYVELGTGIYATTGGGRQTPWAYMDGKGNWHYTHGSRAQPFLKPAVADHADTYNNIAKDYLKNA